MKIDISDFDYILSAVGNAYFSKLTFDDLWQCVKLSETREELDVAIETLIQIRELIGEKHDDK
jgi:hypothetical protein